MASSSRSQSNDSDLQIVEINDAMVNTAGAEDGKCFCGFPKLERVSWRINTPGRRFWNCPNSLTKRQKCNYFDWKDPKLPLNLQCYKDMLLSLKGELDKKESYNEFTFMRRRLQEVEQVLAHEQLAHGKELMDVQNANEGLKVENEGMKEEIAVLKLENAGLKMENGEVKAWLRSLIMLVIVGMAACGWKVMFWD